MITISQTLTFLVQAFLLVQNNELAVLVSFLQDVLALLDVAVVVLQTQERGHQGHVCLRERGHGQITQHEHQTFSNMNPDAAAVHPKTTGR